MYISTKEYGQLMKLKGKVEVQGKIIRELHRDMDGTLMELERLRARVRELERKGN